MAKPFSLSTTNVETIEAIFVKSLQGGSMELVQGVRWFLKKEMKIGSSKGPEAWKKVWGKVGSADKGQSGLQATVKEGLTIAESVLGKLSDA